MTTTARPQWRDAVAAAGRLRAADRQLLLLLARLPLLPVRPLAQLYGTAGPAAVYRRLDRLDEAGLVTDLYAPTAARQAPQLWHLTDLGLAALTHDRGVDPKALARANGLGRGALATTLRRLPDRLALYRLLGALAAGGPGRPRLLAWERPWRRAYRRPRAATAGILRLPARAAFAWRTAEGEVRGEYLLIPDLATAPLRPRRAALAGLFAHRAALARERKAPPVVLVATEACRATAWRDLFTDLAMAHGDAPLPAHVIPWGDLDAGMRRAVELTAAEDARVDLGESAILPALAAPPPDRPLPRLVGTGWQATAMRVTRDKGAGERRRTPGRTTRRPLALDLCQPEWELLDLLARHLSLTRDLAAVALGWHDEVVRRRRNGLIRRGLVRLIVASELGRGRGVPAAYRDLVAREPVEVTAAGLAALAAWHGLTLRGAIRQVGFAGGGPARPLGTRASLLAAPRHTLGVEELFAGLAHDARAAARAGRDEALVEWQNAAACARKWFRPDGYGVYRRGDERRACFLEYDRGTMRRRDWRQKLRAYYDYRDSGRSRRDYDGFPTLLIVAAAPQRSAPDAEVRASATEDLVAGILRDLAIGRTPLPALLTTEGRIRADPAGMLGPVWREATSAARCEWFGPERTTGVDEAASGPRPAWQPRLRPGGGEYQPGDDVVDLVRLMAQSPGRATGD